MRIARAARLVLLSGLFSSTIQVAHAGSPPQQPGRDAVARKPSWKEVDRLVDEQKFEEASKVVAALKDAARASGDDEGLAKALVREEQLRVALGGFETAVKQLREEAWPKAPLPRAGVQLYYAHSLVTYLRDYSWEIGKREKVESKGVLDLKQWTADQIFGEALKTYQELWKERDQWGQKPPKALAEYIIPNTYPEGVRPTLRDAITYLAVELLADTSRWTAEESNSVYRLDFAALLAGNPEKSKNIRLDDPAVHPLLKIGALLDDLEAWHAREGRPEAQLEARLERVRRLSSSFTRDDEKVALRKDLESRLPKFEKYPWWSMGMAEVAERWQSEGDFVKARAVALEGEKAFPKSPGGKRCLNLARQIEAPEMQVQSMSSDAAGKRSIQITHKNLSTVYFRAYPVDLLNRIGTAQDYNLLPSYQDFQKLLNSGKPAAEWSVDLPATPDYKPHRTFVTPKVKDKGLYVILASASKGFGKSGNRILGVNFLVTDLVLVTRQEGDGANVVIVVDGTTGRPAPGVDVILYQFDYQRKHREAGRFTTDAQGLVRLDPDKRIGRNFFLVARRGSDLALDEQGLYFYKPGTPGEQRGSLVYTDRSIYRPLQKILWKVVAWKGVTREAKFAVAAKEQVRVTLYDLNSQVVTQFDGTTNEYGSAAGSFDIPAGRALGEWRIETSWGGNSMVRVEEYKRPTFEVSLKDLDGAPRLNKPVTVTGEAKYYFGLPVASGKVQYRVTREPVYPWWWWFYYVPRQASEMVGAGTAEVQKDGSFKITFTPTADERDATGEGAKSLSYRYTVNADLTDEGGETRSANRGYRVGFLTVEAALSSDNEFIREGQKGTISIARTSLDGAARPGKGAYRVVALKQPDKAVTPAELPVGPGGQDGGDGEGGGNKSDKGYKTPGDQLRPRWQTSYSPESEMSRWADGAEKAKGELTHDAAGAATVQLPVLPPGAYRLRYETTDDFGAKYENWKDFIVAGAKTPLALPALFRAERTSVGVGETARLLVASGLPDQTVYFEVHRDNRLIERRLLDPGKTSLLELPVKESDRGGFSVSMFLVRDHQFLSFNESIFVPWDDKKLQVEFTTFRDKMRPGAKETFRVSVKAPAGPDKAAKAEAGLAEVLAYMYDRSLDLFAPHNPPSPLSLYPQHSSVSYARSSLGQASGAWVVDENFINLPGYPSFEPDHLKEEESYGLGGFGTIGRGGGGGVRMKRASRMPGGAPADMAADEPMAAPPAASAPAPERAKEEAPPKALEARGPAGAKNGGESANADKKAEPLRSNFAETAFFLPNLVTDGSGQAQIEFTVPDSVTSWNVWVHAITRDLRGGTLKKETRSVKELMVRPYLPRFFREGDQADLKMVVNNASDKPLSGQLTFEIFDPETKQDLAPLFGVKNKVQSFTVQPNGGTNVTVPVTAPRRVGVVAVQVTARAGEFGDGELRPLPVLPSRMHLAQSRFVTLRNADKRTMTFEDLAKGGDPSLVNESMVVTLDAQLFYTVLKALPYLAEYPYECTEQTLNRFLSTGIVSSVYAKYPAVAKMAADFGKRETRYEQWDLNDPNRKMTLEESPWLQDARGGADDPKNLINVLDPRIAASQRDDSLDKLKKAQTSSGGFPWFPGGPPSPYMTLYIEYGFAKAAEFGVSVPRDMVSRGWTYLAGHFREEYARKLMAKDVGWEFLTFLNYVASAYPDPSWMGDALTAEERKKILDFSFKHWKQHSPYLKGLLALTLKRAGRDKDAKLVFDSVMDSAKTDRDLGTYWAQEDRSWLWYNDTTETHAFALRAMTELMPKDPRRDGLVQWLLLDKKLAHWKSTRATAEVIYSLVKYMEKEGQLGIREEATVAVGPERATFTFEPDKYVGKAQLVVPGEKIDPKTSSTVTVEKQTKGFMFASATWHFSTEKLPAEDRGDFFAVSRKYYRRDSTGKEIKLVPIAEGAVLQPGDEVEVQVSLRSKHAAEYVHLRDPRGAGFEPATTVSQWKWDLGINWYEEVRDSGENFFFEWLPAGEYTFKYRLRANLGGTFRVGPATVQSMYAPEFTAYSAGNVLVVGAAK